jgi:hypothetical protein
MNILIAGAVAVTVVTAGVTAGSRWPQPGTWGISALKLFALWCLAFLPGWLYVRFLDLRAKALWSEYVLNLHRLGWDLPWHLPMPPVASGFYQRWEAGTHGRAADNIYRQKFEAYYGRQITSTAPDENYSVRSESLFPVFLATAVLAVGWAAVLADQPAVAGRAPLSGAQARLNLRRVGIRTATDLLKAFSVEQEGGKRVFRVPDGLEPPLPLNQLRLLVAVLAAEPGLAPVWNWQRNGVPDCRVGAGPKAA